MKLLPSEHDDMDRARELIASLCEGRMTVEEAKILEPLVIGNSEIRRLYILIVSLQADLYMQAALLSPKNISATHDADHSDSVTSLNDSMIMQAIQDEPADQDILEPCGTLQNGGNGSNRFALIAMVRWRWLAASLALALGVVSAVSLHTNKLPPLRIPSIGPVVVEQSPQTLARIDLAMDIALLGGHAVSDGQRVGNEPLRLVSGVARLVLDSGVVVVLDGPTELYLENKSRLHLVYGKTTLRVPHPAAGFAVITNAGIVTDVGTEFGVFVTPNSGTPSTQSNVVVFEGVVRLDSSGSTSNGAAAQIANAGQAFMMTPNKIEPVPDAASFGHFIRNKDFERRKSSLNLAKAIVTNPDLLAYSFFDADFDRIASQNALQAALHWRSVDGPSAVGQGSGLSGLADPMRSRLFVHGGHSAMLDLDTTVNSELGEHGYIGSSGCIKGSGKTIYLSWISKADILAPSGFGGLSLVYAEQNQSTEFLTFGQVLEDQNFACKVWKEEGPVSNPALRTTIFELNSDTSAPQLRPAAVDTKMHLWVLKIQFGTGKDQISVYLDAGVDEPAQPNLLVHTAELQFNKVRLASGPDALWEFGRFLVGSTYDGVVPR